MGDSRLTRRGVIVIASAAIALVVLIAAAGVGGSYVLAIDALHNHANLSVAQACAHWNRIYAATVADKTPALHSAVQWTLAQLGCAK